MKPRKEIMIITGPSGSGKFSALKVFEDLGFYASDNLPAELFPGLVDLLNSKYKKRSVALVMDARNPDFLLKFEDYRQRALKGGFNLRILFLETQDSILLRRFSETRRRHPLAPSGPILRVLERERNLLQPLKQTASHILDTSFLNIHELREALLSTIKHLGEKQTLPVNLVTFGYRHGLPLDADLVMDVRFLPNPYFEKKLKKLTGKNRTVKNFLYRKPETKRFLALFNQFLKTSLRAHRKEGKTYLTIAFGCTGGRHRSVAIGEWVARNLKKWGYTVNLRHRDIAKDL